MANIHHIATRLIATIVILITLAACGGSDRFNIKGTVDGNATLTIRVVYSDGDRLNTVLTAARDGVFEFQGHSRDGAVVDILDNEYRLLGRFYATNGDKLEAHIYPKAPYKQQIKGNDVTERLTKWLNANGHTLAAGDPVAINAAIAKYVNANPTDIVSTILLMDYYDSSAAGADIYTLLDKLAPEARRTSMIDTFLPSLAYAMPHESGPRLDSMRYYVGRDSMLTHNTHKFRGTLIAISTEKTRQQDSLPTRLKDLYRKLDKKTKLIDLSFDRDSILWRRSIRPDSAKWTQGWTPGGVMARDLRDLRINTIPVYLVIDSTGIARYQGPSLTAATDTLSHLK